MQAAISQGSAVRLRGLEGAAHLNGLAGTCEEWDGAAGRWIVRLRGGERKSLRPDNLGALSRAAPGPRPATAEARESAALDHTPPKTAGEARRREPSGPPDGGARESAAQGGAPPKTAEEARQREPSGPPDGGAAISRGSAVRLWGLEGAAHLNGFTGTCEEWDGAAGRWVVRLGSGERKSLRPGNLGALGRAVAGPRSVVFEAREYAALDGTPPTDPELGMQEDFLRLPDGWEFAPTDPAVVSEVIHKFPWGTLWLICGDGQCHTTSLGESFCARESEPCSSYKKITKRNGTYRPIANHAMDVNVYRVLIRKCAAAEDEGFGTPPKKSRRVQDRGLKMCEEAERHHKLMQRLHRML